MVAKSGDALLRASAVHMLKTRLIPLASLITPNLPEAAVLLDCAEPTTLKQMEQMAEQLLSLGSDAVLLKGGHLDDSSEAVDLLYDGHQLYPFSSPRINTRNTHGTGCTLASAIAAGLASGLSLCEAVQQAKDYIYAAISAADRLHVGHGHGPVHHFHRYW